MADAAPWLDFDYLRGVIESAAAPTLREEIAVVAARWVHVHDPPDDVRRQLGLLLRAGAARSSVEVTPVVCTLSVDFHRSGWLRLARLCRDPVFLRFGTVHTEVRRRPALAINSVREARDTIPFCNRLRHWVSLVERWREWAQPCGCLNCERRLTDLAGTDVRVGMEPREPSREQRRSS